MIENIFTYSVGSFIWGILIALACTGLILFIIKAINQDSYFKPLSYVIALILCAILAYNCTIICSAISMKSDIGFVEGVKLSEIPHLLANNFYDYLNNLIWEKVLWSLLFIVVGIVLTIVTLGRKGNSNRYLSRRDNI